MAFGDLDPAIVKALGGRSIPGTGLEFPVKNTKILIQLFARIPRISDSQIEVFARATAQLIDSLSVNDGSLAESFKWDNATCCHFSEADFRDYKSRYVYKFVRNDDYENYYSKGFFRLGLMSEYADMEKRSLAAGDRFEGRCFSVSTFGEHDTITSTISGYDHLIFSTSGSLKNKNYMKEKFGPIVIKINLNPFSRVLAQSVGAKAKIRKIRYCDLRIYRTNLRRQWMGIANPQFDQEILESMYNISHLVTLFVKPSSFLHEEEVRVAYRMDHDPDRAVVIFDPTLLEFCERIE